MATKVLGHSPTAEAAADVKAGGVVHDGGIVHDAGIKLVRAMQANIPHREIVDPLDTEIETTVTIATIATAAGVETSQLAVLQIFDMYLDTAVTHYMSLYSRLINERTSMIVRMLRSSDYSVAKRSRFPDGIDSDDDESDSEHFGSNTPVDELSKDTLQRDMAKEDVPVVEVNDPLVVVSWPPPPPLAAAHLLALACHSRDTVLHAFHPDLCTAPPPPPRPTPALPADDDGKHTNRTSDGAEEPLVIFVAYHDGNKIVAAVAPDAALEEFARDVLHWEAVRTWVPGPLPRVEARGDNFGLYLRRYRSWDLDKDRPARTLATIFLRRGEKEAIVDDLRQFVSPDSRTWYADHGVPYRRSFLFHGPTDTGKTSMAKALAVDLHRNCCLLSMNSDDLDEDALRRIVEELPKVPVLVLEDVDAMFRSQSELSFSALLKVLDGMASMEGVITIMTTNHMERLEGSALRASRVDRKFHFGTADDYMVEQCMRSFQPTADDETVARFVRVVATLGEGRSSVRSIATLHEFFTKTRGASATECEEKLPAFLDDYCSREEAIVKLKEQERGRQRYATDDCERDDGGDGCASSDETTSESSCDS